jgi:uncharacterized membrane protein (UPF0136 family)
MKEFIVRTSRTVGIMAILGFLSIIVLANLDKDTFPSIFSSSSIAIILVIIFLGAVWGLVGITLSKQSREYSPEQLKTQHMWLGIIFFLGAIFTLLTGAFIPAVLLTIGAIAEWYNYSNNK